MRRKGSESRMRQESALLRDSPLHWVPKEATSTVFPADCTSCMAGTKSLSPLTRMAAS